MAALPGGRLPQLALAASGATPGSSGKGERGGGGRERKAGAAQKAAAVSPVSQSFGAVAAGRRFPASPRGPPAKASLGRPLPARSPPFPWSRLSPRLSLPRRPPFGTASAARETPGRDAGERAAKQSARRLPRGRRAATVRWVYFIECVRECVCEARRVARSVGVRRVRAPGEGNGARACVSVSVCLCAPARRFSPQRRLPQA